MEINDTVAHLTEEYPWKKFEWELGPEGKEKDFNNWAWRYICGGILCANERESQVLKVSTILFETYPDCYSMAQADWSELKDLLSNYINPRRCGQKAKYLIGTAELISQADGVVPNTLKGYEELPGIGYHMSRVMMATCWGASEFAIDVHVRRIMARLGLVDEKLTDRKIEKIVKATVAANQLGHYSRTFVDFGQQVCGYRPKCTKCPLSTKCPSSKVV